MIISHIMFICTVISKSIFVNFFLILSLSVASPKLNIWKNWEKNLKIQDTSGKE